MNKRIIIFMLVFLLGFGFPSLLLRWVPEKADTETYPTDHQEKHQTLPESTANEKPSQKLRFLDHNGVVKSIELEEYVKGVVLAEMPASFEIEAIKAQAIAVRTYTLRRKKLQNKHEGADVCGQSSCCQAYITVNDYLKYGRTEDVQRVADAVEATMGQVLIYQGELIEATYFSSSGGYTEDALAVWGEEIPYLQATESPGEDNLKDSMATMYITKEEFSRQIGFDLSGSPENWFRDVSFTEGYGVEYVNICGKLFKGTEIRNLLGLKSTMFSISVIGETVTITTKGNGHRVGMSQYGAEAMALNGSNYLQILAHYYKGAELTNFDKKLISADSN